VLKGDPSRIADVENVESPGRNAYDPKTDQPARDGRDLESQIDGRVADPAGCVSQAGLAGVDSHALLNTTQPWEECYITLAQLWLPTCCRAFPVSPAAFCTWS
jgi:hypothetical protein